MEKIQLRFHCWEELVDFLRVTNIRAINIDKENKSLTCVSTEADVELALNGYHAVLVA